MTFDSVDTGFGVKMGQPRLQWQFKRGAVVSDAGWMVTDSAFGSCCARFWGTYSLSLSVGAPL